MLNNVDSAPLSNGGDVDLYDASTNDFWRFLSQPLLKRLKIAFIKR